MVSKKVPSDNEIEKLMEELPGKLDRLLEGCSSIIPPYTPNYYEFDEGASALLKPFIEYSDAKFHAGDHSSWYFKTAVTILSKKKHEFEQSLTSLNLQGKTDSVEALRAFTCFKLLLHFFGYASSSPSSNMLKVLDLIYRAQFETDTEKLQHIMEEASSIISDSSTGMYLQANLAMHSGDFDTALEFCDQAIKKLPENTLAYELKARILYLKAEKALEEGLGIEPRDKGLQLAHSVGKRLKTVREKYALGLFTQEQAIEHLEQDIPDVIEQAHPDLDSYKAIVNNYLRQPSLLDKMTLRFLCTGEWLLFTMPRTFDHAASAIEFCKAVETEFAKLIFEPFKTFCLNNVPQDMEIIHESRVLNDFVYGNGKLTLGNMAMVFQLLKSRRLAQRSVLFQELVKFIHSFPQPRLLLGDSGVRSTLTREAVEEKRNSAAHPQIYSMEKAQRTKDWCYILINMLADSKRV